ncbi:hypothetical protein E2C01_040108 [Portunus trituberculatus]|uniref:Uncharacterized protein n=1 Tax=Portunus trituberculatus TaxID=210409 RepID=A0A5B7FM30_PORTR|nr:hypothetical protein [Portunus trituberculatus]
MVQCRPATGGAAAVLFLQCGCCSSVVAVLLLQCRRDSVVVPASRLQQRRYGASAAVAAPLRHSSCCSAAQILPLVKWHRDAMANAVERHCSLFNTAMGGAGGVVVFLHYTAASPWLVFAVVNTCEQSLVTALSRCCGVPHQRPLQCCLNTVAAVMSHHHSSTAVPPFTVTAEVPLQHCHCAGVASSAVIVLRLWL